MRLHSYTQIGFGQQSCRAAAAVGHGFARCCVYVAALLAVPLLVHGQSLPDSPLPHVFVTVERFLNLTEDAADAWIGLGIAESVATDLGGHVESGGDVARLRVMGAYRRVDDMLEIEAQLVDGSTGRVLSALSVEGPASDLFRLEDELARKLTVLLRRTETESASSIPAADDSIRRREPAPPTSASSEPTGGERVGASADAVIDGPPPPTFPEMMARDAQGRVTMRASRLASPLALDGVLDEAVYQDVAPVTGFIQQEPDEGAVANDQTEVWVMFDDDTLYVAARCWSAEPEQMVANEMKRDSWGMFGNESLAVALDTFYDRRNGFGFITNPVGGLIDAIITGERTFNMDWNTVWDARSQRFDQGWTVEISIPFKSLRYRAGPEQVWGINLQRRVASTNEVSFLTPIPAADNLAGWYKMSASATLVDLEVPVSGTRLEVKPYGITDLTTNLNETPPLLRELGGNVGFDVKYGVTQGLTADFTYNTDFAQVEVDQQQVNLTRFSLFFPEKREFFLEGQGIFDFGGGSTNDATTFYFRGGQFAATAPIIFFSRRIGLQDGRTVPIQAGGRLTGKAGPYSVGLLNVQTGDEAVSTAGATNFSVVRVRRDILRRSSVGALFTGRSLSLDGAGSNQAFGVDGLFSFYDNVNVNTYLARTQSPGVGEDDLSYQAQLDYNGDRWGVVAERLGVGANFNPEIGFVRRADFRRNYGAIRFSPRPQSIAAVRKFAWEGSLDYTTDGAGLLETRVRQGLFWTEFENGDRFFAGVTDNHELLKRPFQLAPDVTIGVGEYDFVNTRLVYALGQQRVVSGGVTFDRGGFWGGQRTSLGFFNGRIGLSPQLTIEPSLSFNWIDLPQGRFTTELVSARTTFTVTPRMFVAALLQYNSGSDSLSTNLRFRWEYQPGSELFVVYTEERDTLDPRSVRLENRAFVVKATRLFRF